jgi:hypothetical protein
MTHALCRTVFRAASAFVLALSAPLAGAARADCADVALVLAIDASGSIDGPEFDLQSMGYYRALTAGGTQSAFKNAGIVQIAAVLWGDSAYAPQTVPWHRVASPSDATAFAETLLSMERRVTGNTDIGTGLNAALDLLESPSLCAERLVIDISGDGRASVIGRRSIGASLDAARKRAEALGVTINALAITKDEPELAEYYKTRVALGPLSFVMEVDGFETFHIALAEKLHRELLAEGQAPDPADPVTDGRPG